MKKVTKIHKAVFPVAGLGTRFLPATKAQPKEMLPIVDKPLIQYAVEEAYEAGIRHMIFVTGRNKRAIEDHFDTAYELESELESSGKHELLELVRSLQPEDMNCSFVRQPRSLAEYRSGERQASFEVRGRVAPDLQASIDGAVEQMAGLLGQGTAEQLERKLESVLAKPVEVSLRELLTADETALANEQASLAQLRESVMRLQSVAERDAAQRSAGPRASEAMHQRVLAHFGQLEILEGGQRARWQLNGTAGLDIVEARRLEQALATDDPGALQVQVVPALQALPPVAFGDDQSALDAAWRRSRGHSGAGA